jgi:hypothetical protein
LPGGLVAVVVGFDLELGIEDFADLEDLEDFGEELGSLLLARVEREVLGVLGISNHAVATLRSVNWCVERSPKKKVRVAQPREKLPTVPEKVFCRAVQTSNAVRCDIHFREQLFTMSVYDEGWYASLAEKSGTQSHRYDQKSKVGSRRRETIQVGLPYLLQCSPLDVNTAT